MILVKAFVHQGQATAITNLQESQPKEGEVRIKLKSAGLNHRDLNIPTRRKGEEIPLTLGSDGAGIIEMVGSGVKNFQVDDEVIINPALGWDLNSAAPPEGFEILGMPDHGTFAEKIVLSAEQVEKKPSHLTWEEAGVLALPAMTGYRALFTKAQVKEGDTVFIPGAGSGVATYLIQFAKVVGAKVIVSSRSEEKKKKALGIGADRAISTNSDWEKELAAEQIDIVIDSVGEATFNRCLTVLKRGGKMVTFGATTDDDITINIRKFFYGQYQLLGSTMGSRQELHAMLELITQHEIHSVVDKVYQLDDAEQAFDYLRQGKQFGKVALTM